MHSTKKIVLIGFLIWVRVQLGWALTTQIIGTDSVQLQLEQASTLEQSQQIPNAISIYQNVFLNNPSSPTAPFAGLRLGSCYNKLGQTSTAIGFLQQVADNYNTSSSAPIALQMIAFIKSADTSVSIPNQISAFQQIIQNYPNSSQAKLAPTYIKNLQNRLNMMPTDSARAALLPLFTDAWASQKSGLRTQAKNDFEKIISSPWANDTCKAEAQIQKAGLIFEIAKGEDKQYKVTGPADRNRLLDLARQECQKVYQFNPDLKHKAIADLMTMESYYFQDDFDSVINTGKNFFSLYLNSFTWPDDKDVLTHIGFGKFTMGYAKARKGDHLGAIKDFQDIISLWPQHPVCDRAQLEIARSYYSLHNYQQAISAFQLLISTYPKSPFVQQAKDSINTLQRIFGSTPEVQSLSQLLVKPSLDSLSNSNLNCGPVALKTIFDKYGVPVDDKELSQLSGLSDKGTNLDGLAKAAQAKGFYAMGVKVTTDSLESLPLPAIVHLNIGTQNHFVVLETIDSDKLSYLDNHKQIQESKNNFFRKFTGYALAVYPPEMISAKVVQISGSTPDHLISLQEMNNIYGAGVAPPPPAPPDECRKPGHSDTTTNSANASGVQSPSGSNGGNTSSDPSIFGYGGSEKAAAFGSVIDLTNGNVFHGNSGTRISSRGQEVSVDFLHLSFSNPGKSQPGPFGYGTNWSYGDTLTDTGNEIYWNPANRFSSVYFINEGSYYDSPAGDYGTLTKNADSSYTLNFKDGSIKKFNPSGHLISQSDNNGNQITFQYTGNSINAILDASSQTTYLYYDSLGRVTTVKDPAGRKMKYAYSTTGDLVSISNPANEIRYFYYDNYHRVTTVIEKNNLMKKYFYDSVGKCTSLQIADGNNPTLKYAYSYGYDTTLYISWIIDPNGNTTYYFYNNITWQTDAILNSNGVTHYFTHDNAYHLTSDILGNATIVQNWDSNGNVISITNSGNFQSTYYYDSYNNLTASKDPFGNTSTYFYNINFARITAVLDPMGSKAYFYFDSYGQQTALQDPSGQMTFNFYDSKGNLIKLINLDNSTVSYYYDSYGNQTSVIDELGHRTDSLYDVLGRVTAIINNAGSRTGYSYDNGGHLQTLTDSKNNSTINYYNTFGQLTCSKNAVGNVILYFYNYFGSMTARRDANNHSTLFYYDAIGQLTCRVYDNGTRTYFGYDIRGNMNYSNDPAVGIANWQYDSLNRLTSYTNPGGNITYSYNNNNQRVGLKDPDGNFTAYYYDNDNRLSIIRNYSYNQWTQYAYDPLNRKIFEILPNGMITNYNYSPKNLLLSSISYQPTDNFNRANNGNIGSKWTEISGNWSIDTNQLLINSVSSINYSVYTGVGNIIPKDLEVTITTHTSGQYQNGYLVFGYTGSNNFYFAGYDNNAGQLRIGHNSGGTYVLDAYANYPLVSDFALRFQVTLSGATVNLSRLESTGFVKRLSYTFGNTIPAGYTGVLSDHAITHFDDFLVDNNTTVIARYTYNYDGKGNRISRMDISGNTTFYAYNSLDQLTSESGIGSITYSKPYMLDAMGNRTKLGSGTGATSYGYNNLNQLIASTTNTTPTNYSYDLNGNLISRGSNSYSWNYENQLTSTPINLSESWNYSYDVLGRKYEKDRYFSSYTLESGIRYFYDGNNVLMERVNGGNLIYLTNAVYTLIPASNKQIISVRRNGVDYFYHYDPSGNVIFLTDSNGNICSSYYQDLFGNILFSSGSADNNYHINTRELDTDLGFHYLNQGWFDSSIGRLISPKNSSYLINLN